MKSVIIATSKFDFLLQANAASALLKPHLYNLPEIASGDFLPQLSKPPAAVLSDKL